MEKFSLSRLPAEAKTLVRLFLLALLLGYGISLLKAADKTHLSLAKIIVDYRGSEHPEEDMAFPKEYAELLQNTHAHALSVPLVYFLLSLIFLGTTISVRVKQRLIVLLFLSFFLEYLALWGLRYVHKDCVYITFVAHAISGPIYLYMCVKSLLALKLCAA